METKGLTLTIVAEAQAANFGQGLGNTAELKKIIGADGLPHTYISRQALRYSLVNVAGFDNTPIKVDKKVAQFAPDITIEDYPEIDLFGYMRTVKGSHAATRSAVARLSHAISTQPFTNELDFLTNLGLAKRVDKKENGLMPSSSENHRSLYVYTLTVDLDRVGIDEGVELDKEAKAERVKQLLNAVRYLYRDIRGRREDLSPVFAVGGIYSTKSPIYTNALHIEDNVLNVDRLLDYRTGHEEDTLAASRHDTFTNQDEIEAACAEEGLDILTINQMFERLNEGIDAYYARN